MKNADMLSGMVSDIHNAMMDYQVGSWTKLIALMPDIQFRLHCSRGSMNRVANSL